MTAPALILQVPSVGDEIKRWALAGAIVSAAHFGLMAGYLLMPEPEAEGSAVSPAVIVELAPVPVAPSSPNDLAPGPEMVEAQPTPKPPPQVEPEVVEPMPKLEAPAEVTLPDPKPKVAEKKPEESPDTQKTETPPVDQTVAAPRTTAAPRSDQHTAATPQAPNPGSSDSRSIARWRDLVVARLQSVKRYPSGADGSAVVMISFTVDRNGQVIARSVVHGSGNAAFDQEALAMVIRAAPYPPVPVAITGPSIILPVPIKFSRQ